LLALLVLAYVYPPLNSNPASAEEMEK
jgi:hypothetical protein